MESYAAGETTPPLIEETIGANFEGTVSAHPDNEALVECASGRRWMYAPQVDHAIPRSRGGNATFENGQTTCWWCNASKGARDFPVNPPPGFEGMWPPEWWGLP